MVGDPVRLAGCRGGGGVGGPLPRNLRFFKFCQGDICSHPEKLMGCMRCRWSQGGTARGSRHLSPGGPRHAQWTAAVDPSPWTNAKASSGRRSAAPNGPPRPDIASLLGCRVHLAESTPARSWAKQDSCPPDAHLGGSGDSARARCCPLVCKRKEIPESNCHSNHYQGKCRCLGLLASFCSSGAWPPSLSLSFRLAAITVETLTPTQP